MIRYVDIYWLEVHSLIPYEAQLQPARRTGFHIERHEKYRDILIVTLYMMTYITVIQRTYIYIYVYDSIHLHRNNMMGCSLE